MKTYILRRGNRREAGKYVMDWKGGQVFCEGDVITSEDLGFPLRERQLVNLSWLEEIRPVVLDESEDESEVPNDGSDVDKPRRKRGRPAIRR